MRRSVIITSCLAALLTTTPVAALPLCEIVHNGNSYVRQHEMAHCWGWKHKEGNPNSAAHNPPAVPQSYLAKGDYPHVDEHIIRIGSVSKRCEYVTGFDYTSSIFLRTVKGCAIGGLMK